MDKVKKVFNYFIFILLALIPIILFSACNKNEKLYQDVTLVVYHPETGEEIEENKIYKFEYDGNPKIFTAKVKLDESGRYLEDKDFENNDWKSHIKLLILYEGEVAYKDYNESGVLNWENDWPLDRGIYKIQLKFNNHGPLDDVKNSPKYIKSWFYFTIEIV